MVRQMAITHFLVFMKYFTFFYMLIALILFGKVTVFMRKEKTIHYISRILKRKCTRALEKLRDFETRSIFDLCQHNTTRRTVALHRFRHKSRNNEIDCPDFIAFPCFCRFLKFKTQEPIYFVCNSLKVLRDTTVQLF